MKRRRGLTGFLALAMTLGAFGTWGCAGTVLADEQGSTAIIEEEADGTSIIEEEADGTSIIEEEADSAAIIEQEQDGSENQAEEQKPVVTSDEQDDVIYGTPATDEVNLAAASPRNRLSFNNDTVYPWTVVEDNGRTYVKSANQGMPNSSSTLSLTVTVNTSTQISFDYKAWGEGTSTLYDKCYFKIDDQIEVQFGAAQNDWLTQTSVITQGTHTLEWGYTKDSSVDPDGDYFAIDNVNIDLLSALSDVLNVKYGELYFENDATYPWTFSSGDDRTYAVSGNIGIMRSRSYVSTTVTLDDYYDLAFDYRVYSFGDLEFYINDKKVFSNDYVRSWKSYRYLLEPGTYTLKWAYFRDTYVGDYEDTACLDDISITPAVKPTGIDVEDEIRIPVNTNDYIYCSFLPEETLFRNRDYVSDNPSVIRMNGALMIALQPGTAHVTISSREYPEVKKTVTVIAENKGIPKATFYGINWDGKMKKFSSVYTEEVLEELTAAGQGCYLNGNIYGYYSQNYFYHPLEHPEEVVWYENILEEGDSMGSMSFDPVTKYFYGIMWDDSENYYSLVKIKPESGVPEVIASDWQYGMAFSIDQNGMGWVYAEDSSYDDWLYKVNLSTGSVYKQYHIDEYDTVSYMTIDPNTNEFYMLARGGSEGSYLYWADVKSLELVKLGFVGEIESLIVIPESGQTYDPSPFLDVKDSSQYYYNPVLWAYFANPQITTGKNPPKNDLFMPNEKCTRAEVVTFLWRLAGCPEPTITENPFTDVRQYNSKGNEIYYYKPVLWALEKGITTGKSETAFDPSGQCTRKQFVTFLWRAYGEPEPETYLSPFTDVQDVTKYWYTPVLWALDSGVTTGTGDGTTFNPDGILKRKEVVTFMYRGYVKKGRP